MRNRVPHDLLARKVSDEFLLHEMKDGKKGEKYENSRFGFVCWITYVIEPLLSLVKEIRQLSRCSELTEDEDEDEDEDELSDGAF